MALAAAIIKILKARSQSLKNNAEKQGSDKVSSAIDNIEKGLNIAKESGNLIENILNKIPQYRANALFIKEIEESSDLTTAEKMALLYNHKAIKKQAKNLLSIYSLTESYLNEKNKSLENEIPLLNEDWFDYYNDVVKNVSDEEMQTIWAKILAGECENKGSISKKTISIMQTIDSEMAEKFSFLCSHSLIFTIKENKYIHPVFPRLLEDEYMDNQFIYTLISSRIINNVDLRCLQTIGLLTFDSNASGHFGYRFNKGYVSYYGTEFHIISEKDCIPTGKVGYTKYGNELAWLLHDSLKEQKDDEYIEFVKNYLHEVDPSIKFYD